ncbi:MAG: hypothetical protein AUG49_01140 [Catenulispora sp. 13_1_20CM_3_70_7]|nr:hypothetical protein [Catenulisporales bacterium]OLE28863.1 MAG: hypothetical protein AUG49_01140 [Catenulispora sp. 13_1_20CM_3_70_7]
MTAETDQEMFRYLAELSTLAEGRMSPTSRNQLVSRTRAEIESRVRARKATKSADVRQILLGMGRPEALVMAEANKDPLYAARERQRRGSDIGVNAYGAASVFSPEVDPNVARLVTPEALTNPLPDRFGASDSGGETLPGPEIPAEPDPFGAGSGEWGGGEAEGGQGRAEVATGPQIPIESGGSFTPAATPPPSTPPAIPLAAGPMVRRTARNHTQAFVAVVVLCLGALVNAVALSPYTIAFILVGYLLAMTSYSFTAGEKRFALIGVPIAAFLFYAFGLFLARGRTTGHNAPLNHDDTWQAAKDGFAVVPTMLGLLGALYLLWRLFKAVAKSG